jgi:hypothetical protein
MMWTILPFDRDVGALEYTAVVSLGAYLPADIPTKTLEITAKLLKNVFIARYLSDEDKADMTEVVKNALTFHAPTDVYGYIFMSIEHGARLVWIH